MSSCPDFLPKLTDTLSAEWLQEIGHLFSTPTMQNLAQTLVKKHRSGHTIYPNAQSYFAAFDYTSYANLKVVILGQDPYHGAGQANGLSFSVNPGVRIPPSLRNIYTELQEDLAISPPLHGNLKHWAEQGVLLLNSILTVEKDQPNSHAHLGWQWFTDQIIHHISQTKEHVVFILWGKYAQSKKTLINQQVHYIVEAPHPSPLSSYRGFFGSKPFSKTNAWLQEHGKTPIDWSVS